MRALAGGRVLVFVSVIRPVHGSDWSLGTAMQPLPPHFFAGDYVGQDPAALTDALIETRKFFDDG